LNEIPAFHGVRLPPLFHIAIKSLSRQFRGGVLHNKRVPGLPVTQRVLICGAVFLAGNLAVAETNAPQLPDGPGKATMEKICSGCHAPEIVLGRHETEDGWTQIVSDMVNKGANGTDEEFNTIIDYLAKNFPAKPSSQSKSNDSDAKNR